MTDNKPPISECDKEISFLSECAVRELLPKKRFAIR